MASFAAIVKFDKVPMSEDDRIPAGCWGYICEDGRIMLFSTSKKEFLGYLPRVDPAPDIFDGALF